MDLEEAASAVKAAFVCGIISTVMTLIVTLISLSQGGLDLGGIEVSVFTFIDVAALAGLTVGLFFKSRVCAVLMLVYFIVSKYAQGSGSIHVVGMGAGLAFLYFYAKGVYGAFVYHKLAQEGAYSEPSEPAIMAVIPAVQLAKSDDEKAKDEEREQEDMPVYFVVIGSSEKGPFSLVQLRELFAAGRIEEVASVRMDGSEGTMLLADLFRKNGSRLPPRNTETGKFRFGRDGKEIGEYPEEAVPVLLQSGALRGSDFYWREGMNQWEFVSSHWKVG